MRLLGITFLFVFFSCSKDGESTLRESIEKNEAHFTFQYNGTKYQPSHPDGLSLEVKARYDKEKNGVLISGQRYIKNPNHEHSILNIYIYEPLQDSTYELIFNDPRIEPYPQNTYAVFNQSVITDTLYINGRVTYPQTPCYYMVDEAEKSVLRITHFSEHPDFKGVYAIGGEFEMTLVRRGCDSLDPKTLYPKKMTIINGTFFRGGF